MRAPVTRWGALLATPWMYDFFAAFRLIESHHVQQPRIGYSVHPKNDPVKFVQHLSMSFQGTSLVHFEMIKDDPTPRLAISGIGLLGTNGPMPLQMTEFIWERTHRHADFALAGFLDLFHHRMVSLFYKAWTQSRPIVSFDRPHENKYAEKIGSLIGLGYSKTLDQTSLPRNALLKYVGLLSRNTRNPQSLSVMLETFFGIQVDIEEFVAEWLPLPPEELTRLSSASRPVLGQNTVLGRSIWCCQHKFRVHLRSLDLDRLHSFLPQAASFKQLNSWVTHVVGLAIDWDVHLHIQPESVPPLRLGSQLQLGWTTWLSKSTQLNGKHVPKPVLIKPANRLGRAISGPVNESFQQRVTL